MTSYYQFKIKGVDCDVNDILQAVDNKLKENNMIVLGWNLIIFLMLLNIY